MSKQFEEFINISENEKVIKLVDVAFACIGEVLESTEESLITGSDKVNAVISCMIIGELQARLRFSVPEKYHKDMLHFVARHELYVVEIAQEEADEREVDMSDLDDESIVKLVRSLEKIFKSVGCK